MKEKLNRIIIYFSRLHARHKIRNLIIGGACKKSSKTYNNSPESVQKIFATKCTSQRVIDFL